MPAIPDVIFVREGEVFPSMERETGFRYMIKKR